MEAGCRKGRGWAEQRVTGKHVKQIVSEDLLCNSGNSNWGSVTTQNGWMGREVARSFQRERTYVYLWLIHVDVWQKPSQYCKVIILQLKINTFKKYIAK